MPSNVVIEEYRKKLRQAAWRLQYYERKRLRNELVFDYIQKETHGVDLTNLIEEMGLHEAIQLIPYPQGRAIIYELFVNDKTEKELAKEMQVTQQAVSKWKRKSLKYLCQTLSS